MKKEKIKYIKEEFENLVEKIRAMSEVSEEREEVFYQIGVLRYIIEKIEKEAN